EAPTASSAAAYQERIDSIAQQLSTRLKLSHAAGGSTVQLSLRPRELGDVTVQLAVKNGGLTAHVVVDRADTGQFLKSTVEELRRSLEVQGLTIQHFSVDVNDGGARDAFAQSAAGFGQGQSGTGGNANGSSDSDELEGVAGLDVANGVTPDELHDG